MYEKNIPMYPYWSILNLFLPLFIIYTFIYLLFVPFFVRHKTQGDFNVLKTFFHHLWVDSMYGTTVKKYSVIKWARMKIMLGSKEAMKNN